MQETNKKTYISKGVFETQFSHVQRQPTVREGTCIGKWNVGNTNTLQQMSWMFRGKKRDKT